MIIHDRLALDPTDISIVCVCGWRPSQADGTLAQHLREKALLMQKLSAINQKRCACTNEAGREACRSFEGRVSWTWV